jgi:hypothetical protein
LIGCFECTRNNKRLKDISPKFEYEDEYTPCHVKNQGPARTSHRVNAALFCDVDSINSNNQANCQITVTLDIMTTDRTVSMESSTICQSLDTQTKVTIDAKVDKLTEVTTIPSELTCTPTSKHSLLDYLSFADNASRV